MTKKEMKIDIENRAATLRKKGLIVIINERLPFIAVDKEADKGADEIFFAQGESALQLINDTPDYVSTEDFILYFLDSAGQFDNV